MTPDLQLDPLLKSWVLIPLLVVMVLVTLIKLYVTQILEPQPPIATPAQHKEFAYYRYAELLRLNGYNLSPASFARRVQAILPKFRGGEYLADPEEQAPSPIPNLADPRSSEAMLSGMRNQILNYVPQTLMMQWVSGFFGTVIVMKLPFPLTAKFKSILQAGVDTRDLDVRYVSSISWFFLLAVGLPGMLSLVESEPKFHGIAVQGTEPPLPASAYKRKLFTQQADSLELAKSKYVLDDVLDRVLEMP